MQKQLPQIVRKEFSNYNFLPYKGLEIEDGAWENPKKIKSVSFNPSKECVYLILANDIIPNKLKFSEQIELYKTHSWKVLG
jgi:hypothetical protein